MYRCGGKMLNHQQFYFTVMKINALYSEYYDYIYIYNQRKREVIIPEFPWGDAVESVSELPLGFFSLLSCLWSLIFAMIAAAFRAVTSSGDCWEWGSEIQKGFDVTEE